MDREARLGDVAEFVNGFAFKPLDWHEDGAPIIRIQNLTDATKPFNRSKKVVADRYQVRPGDLLVSWSATLGVFEWKKPEVGLLNQHIFRVLPDSSRITKTYLRYMLIGALGDMERHLHGATMKHVNRDEFLSTRIPLPTLGEQRRIAELLREADTLRARRRQALFLLDGLARSIFVEMFGEPIANPNGWPRRPLSELLTGIDSGHSPVCLSRPAQHDEWAVLKLGAVTYGTYNSDQNKALPPDVPPRTKLEVLPGDLLFTRKNNAELVGATAFVEQTPRRLLLPDLIFRLQTKCDGKVDKRYLQQLMMFPSKRRQIQALATGSAASMPNISKARLRTVPIELPDPSLQETFAHRMLEIDSLVDLSRQSIIKIDAVFNALQQRAFSGRL